MGFGSDKWQQWITDEEASLPILEHAYKSGINTWDTADIYSHGMSERIIAKAIKQYNIPRNKLVLLSKCYNGINEEDSSIPVATFTTNDGEMVNQVGLSRKHVFDAVEKSVERPGTYIDVLQIHRLDRETPREEIMRVLNDVVEKDGMQNYYNLLYCEEEREMTDKFLDNIIHSREDKINQEIISRVEEIAKKNNVSMACIAIAWVIKQGVCLIIWLNSKERVGEAVRNSNFKLSDEDAKHLQEKYALKERQGY
ncbi:alcohol dehydrogenase [Fusarium oxysporum f. sp. lycopersici MN25]|nr:alcohol dehydrogenase [Fusarium oxysporum f. sp. lycopersici MN25]